MTQFEKENEEVFAIVRSNPTRKIDLSSKDIVIRIRKER